MAAKVIRLESLRFFCGEYIKQKLYNPLPKTFEDLMANITRKMQMILMKILHSEFSNFLENCNLVISAQGGHIKEN